MSSDHYFSATPSSSYAPRTIQVTLQGRAVELTTAGGTFSPDRLDAGTGVLLNNVPAPAPGGNLLDIGCGWGPITLSLAMASPHATVWAVDVNERSLELTRQNAASLGLENVRVCKPDEVPDDIVFRTIWSNPPIRVGKDELHGLLRRWLPRLDERSDAWLVVARNLGSDSLQRWLDATLDSTFSTSRAATSKGYRVLRVRKHGTPRTDTINLV
ncbi:methyltransferase [Microbacterium mitrae]|uniref:Methyltransferase n=1 Tax=Microbacterium mitrae TaxID=664640 RepID=A0A5C8HQD1_9MICO|nr:methyltransferase [Microbacterium mitrae]TXK04663.1 methyltransferase [Microbacterium mitrae]